MKKKDLRTGHLVLCKTGEKFIVIDNCISDEGELCAIYVNEGTTFDYIDDTLLEKKEVIRVYEPRTPADITCILRAGFEEKDWSLIWERKEDKVICEVDGVAYSESTLRSLIRKATR